MDNGKRLSLLVVLSAVKWSLW